MLEQTKVKILLSVSLSKCRCISSMVNYNWEEGIVGKKVIFHIDVNSAFLSWEAVYRIRHLGGKLDLRIVPSAVGGDISKRHGIILAKSIPAKKYHIQTGEPVVDALRKCPELVLVPPNYELYEKSSLAFMEILRKYLDIVEQYSIDEAYIDMTGTDRLFGPAVVAANTIKDEIYQTLGFTVNVGYPVINCWLKRQVILGSRIWFILCFRKR